MPHVSTKASPKQVPATPCPPNGGNQPLLRSNHLPCTGGDHSILLDYFHADLTGTIGRTGYIITFDVTQRAILACSAVEGPPTPTAAARSAFNALGLPANAAVSIVVQCDFLGGERLALAISALMPHASIEVRAGTSRVRPWAERLLAGFTPPSPTT